MSVIQDRLRKLHDYNQLVGISKIARRYFAMNAFDGVLTMIGILAGSWAAEVAEARVIITTGLATAVAMGISGLWGTYLTESAERERDINELSALTLTDMRKTRIGRAARFAAVAVALVDVTSVFLASLIVLLPFFFADQLPQIRDAYVLALGLALGTLFLLGLFLGHISQRHKLAFGIKTLVAGVLSIAISLLLGAG